MKSKTTKVRRYLAAILTVLMIFQQATTSVIYASSEAAVPTVTEAPAAQTEETPEKQVEETPEEKTPTEEENEGEKSAAPTEAPAENEAEPEVTVTPAAEPIATEAPAVEATATPVPEATEVPEATPTEVPKKTEFVYDDSRVSIIANAGKTANLPQDAELKADYMAPGSNAYNAAIAAFNSQLGNQLGISTENIVDYVLYDVYFQSASEGGRIEPNDYVTVSMNFKTAETTTTEGEVVDSKVVHLDNDGSAEIVNGSVDLAEDGTVQSITFTNNSFSPYGAVRMYAATGTVVSEQLENNVDNISWTVTDLQKNPITSDKTYDINSGFMASMTYALNENNRKELVAKAGNADTITLKWKIPSASLIVNPKPQGSGPIKMNNENCGTYFIHEDGTVDFNVNTSFLRSKEEVSGTFEYMFKLDSNTSIIDDKIEITFPGTTTPVIIKIKKPHIDGEKKYTYNNETKKITFTIELKNNSNRDATEVIVVDTPLLSDITKPDGTKISKSNLRINYSSMKWEDGTSVSAEKTTDGFKITNISISKGETKKITYEAEIINLDWIGNDGRVEGLNNKIEWFIKNTKDGENTSWPYIIGFKSGKKSASSTTDGTGIIHWTVDLNTGTVKKNVSSYQYVDIMTSDNQVFDWASFKLYRIENDKETEITPFTVQHDGNDAKTFTATLPSDAGEYQYRIKYDTKPKTSLTPSDPVQKVTVNNGGKFNGTDVDSANGESVGPKAKPFIEKSFNKKSDVTYESEAVITINPSNYKGGVLKDFTFSDILAKVADSTTEITDEMGAYSGFVFDEQTLNITVSESDTNTRWTENFSKTSSAINKGAKGNDRLSIKFDGTYKNTIIIKYSVKLEDRSKLSLEKKDGKEFYRVWNSAVAGGKLVIRHVQFDKPDQLLLKKGNSVYDSENKCWYIDWELWGNVKNDWDKYGATNLGGKDVVINDNLPNGLTYVVGSAKYLKFNGDQGEQGRYDEQNNPWRKFEPTSNNGTLTFTIKSVTNEGICIKFRTKVSEIGAYKNTAQWEDQTAETTVTVGEKDDVLYKNGNVVTVDGEDSQIEYTIKVNKNSRKYLQNSETLILSDILPDNVELEGGVDIYEGDTSNKLEGAYYEYDSSNRKLTIYVPDSTYATVKYRVTPDLSGVSADSQGYYNIQIDNTVELTGYEIFKSESKNWYAVQKSAATITGKGIFQIKKVNSQDLNHVLKGAKFKLGTVSFGNDGKPVESEYSDSVETDDKGIATFRSVKHNQIYYYYEETAPQGYQLDNTKKYFCYHDSGDNKTEYDNLVIAFNKAYEGTKLETYQGEKMIIVSNKQQTDFGNLQLKKTFAGEKNGKDLNADQKKAIHFTVTGPDNYSRTVTYNEFGQDGTYTLDNLPTGTYQVVESGAEDLYEGYKLSTTYSVTDGKTEVTSGVTAGVTVTNTYSRKTGTLEVTKTVSGLTLTEKQKKALTFTVNGPNGYSSSRTYDQFVNGSWKLENLPLGEYTVTETHADIKGYSRTTTYNVNGTEVTKAELSVAEGRPVSIMITNTYTRETGSLQLKKTFAGEKDGKDLNADQKKAIHFTVTGPDNYSRTVTYNEFGQDGTYTLDNLPTGTYQVVESGAEDLYEGYKLSTTYSVTDGKTEVTSGVTAGVTVTNTYSRKTGTLEVTKTVSGLTLTEKQKKALTFTVNGPNGYSSSRTYDQFVNGSWKLENLPLGKYTVTETNADMEGYKLTTTYSVDGGKVTVTNEKTASITITNDYTKILVKISKVDATNQKELEGAHIQVIDKDGKIVDEWTSVKEPHVVNNLKPGETYTLRETVAPDGYTVTSDTTFTLKEDGTVDQTKTTATVSDKGVVLVEDNMTSVSISKVDITSQKELAGAHIQILDKDGKVVEEWDSTDKAYTIKGLKTGETYTLRETVAPNGYYLKADTTFTLKADGSIDTEKTTTTISKEGILLVEDTAIPTPDVPSGPTAKISKVDVTSQQELEGAKLQVIDKNGNVVDEWISGKTAHVTTELKAGETYTLRETVAPDGYLITSDTTFTLKEDGTVDQTKTTATVSDKGVVLVEDNMTSVSISKVDITSQKELAGAHIQILDKDGKVVEEWDSTDKAYTIKGLKTGETYTLRETVAPNGYYLKADTTFTLKADGSFDTDKTTTTISSNGVLLVEDTQKTVKTQVSKVDADTYEVLGGAHLQVIDPDGKVVAEWDSDKEAYTLTDLKPGVVYTLHETAAPKGYKVAEDTTFQLNEDGTIDTENTTTAISDDTLLVKDEKKESKDVSVSVTKNLVTVDGTVIGAVDATYYVALYSDTDCTERVSDVLALNFKNASSSTVTFTGLEKGQTYYVGECEADGTCYLANICADGTMYMVDFSDGNAVTVDNADGSTTVYFDNQFEKIPDGYYKEAELNITKKLVGSDGKAKNSNEIFYAGIFADEGFTQLSTDVSQNIVPLDLAGGSEATALVNVALPESGSITLYVTEVDSNGKPVAGAASFKYDVTVDNAQVTLNDDNLSANVVITNTENSTKVTPTPGTPNTPNTPNTTGGFSGKSAVRTGDSTPIGGFIALFAAAAVIAGAAVFFKRRRKDEK